MIQATEALAKKVPVSRACEALGFPRGSLIEGLLMAVTGALGGLALLLAFRLLRALVERLKT